MSPTAGSNLFWPFSDDLYYHDGKAVYISEYGVYHLAMKFQLPIGEKFRDWIAEVVVPTIRRTGQYKLHKQTADLGEQLIIQEQKILELCKKVAVMTIRNKTKPVFQIYKHLIEPKYLFIRTQKRSLYGATKKINPEEYDLIVNEVNVPNSINILKRLKEKLIELDVSFTAWKNTITTV